MLSLFFSKVDANIGQFMEHNELIKKLVIEVPSQVDGKRRNLARVSDFVSWDEACRVPRHKITHDKKEKFTRFTVKLAS